MPTITKSNNEGKSPKSLRFIPINKNVLAWPFARHGRTRLEWQVGRRASQCDVSRGVTLELSNKCKVRRHPTAFDTVALLTLTTLARRKGYALAITNIEILAAMGLSTNSKNRALIAKSLELWNHLTLHFRDWYWPERKERAGKKVSESFKPVTVVGEDAVRRIHMDPNWVRATSRYFQGLPTPLPTQASALNLVCLVFDASSKGKDEDGYTVKRFNSKRWLTRRLGLNGESNNRNVVLVAAMEDTQAWFKSKVGWSGRKWDLIWDVLPSGHVEVRYLTRMTKNLKRKVKAARPHKRSVEQMNALMNPGHAKKVTVIEDVHADY